MVANETASDGAKNTDLGQEDFMDDEGPSDSRSVNQ